MITRPMRQILRKLTFISGLLLVTAVACAEPADPPALSATPIADLPPPRGDDGRRLGSAHLHGRPWRLPLRDRRALRRHRRRAQRSERHSGSSTDRGWPDPDHSGPGGGSGRWSSLATCSRPSHLRSVGKTCTRCRACLRPGAQPGRTTDRRRRLVAVAGASGHGHGVHDRRLRAGRVGRRLRADEGPGRHAPLGGPCRAGRRAWRVPRLGSSGTPTAPELLRDLSPNDRDLARHGREPESGRPPLSVGERGHECRMEADGRSPPARRARCTVGNHAGGRTCPSVDRFGTRPGARCRRWPEHAGRACVPPPCAVG